MSGIKGKTGVYQRKPFTKEHKHNISIVAKKRIGNKGNDWKGGLCLDMRTYWRNWRLKNIEKVRFWDLRNKHNRRTSEGSYTKEEWDNLKEKYNSCCACCKSKKKLTIDHIIPIKLGGTNYITNIQPLCHNCNSHKRITIIKYNI